jgi:murein DD-endopeptidase MepM/ murein hydrolase activator NlpD
MTATYGTAFVLLLAAATTTDPRDAGRALTEIFYKGGTSDLDDIWSRFSPEMQKHMGSVDALRAFRKKIDEWPGTETEVVEENVDTGDTDVYLRIARFSKAKRLIEVGWTLGADGMVTGFWIQPKREEAASERLDYTTKADLRLPFDGPWFVAWGGRTITQNQHATHVQQRFAYDLLVKKDGQSHSGKGDRNEDYYCFDREILSPADGTVIATENGVPDNAVPGQWNKDDAYANFVIVDHGHQEFSYFIHFRQGSVKVRAGEKVKRGQVIGRCGNSGRSSEPHLHYHMQDSANFGAGWGLPVQFQHYRADGNAVERGEPTRGQTIEAGDLK